MERVSEPVGAQVEKKFRPRSDPIQTSWGGCLPVILLQVSSRGGHRDRPVTAVRVLWIRNANISRQFLLFALMVLVAGMATIGSWVQHEIRHTFIAQTADTSALFVDRFISHHVEDLKHGNRLEAASVATLDDHLLRTPLRSDLVTVKLWTEDGTVAYSTAPDLIGRSFPMGDELLAAFAGVTASHISDLSEPEHVKERAIAESLIETYTPVRSIEDGTTVAVAEFYQRPDSLLAAISSAQLRGWVIVVGATAVMYLMLVGMATGASRLIRSQREELEENVDRLSELLAVNQRLHQRTRGAAARATALNEQFLQQVSADLHDGPAQNIALARIRVDTLGNGATGDSMDLETINVALDSALTDIRSIARGLRTPEIEMLTPADTAGMAIRTFEQSTRSKVKWGFTDLPDQAPLSTKIALFRVIQEALANSYKHARDATRSITMTATDQALVLEVADDGPGFDPRQPVSTDSLGLDGMRERVEMLGGSFEIISAHTEGTRINASIPLEAATDE